MAKNAENIQKEAKKVSSGGFIGRYDHALDPKKRLTIPSVWRDALGESGELYVFPVSGEKKLQLIPKVEMDALLDKLRSKSLFDKVANTHLAAIGAASEQLSFDSQGRIRIHDKFLKYAELADTVAMVGSVRMIELCNPAMLSPSDTVDMVAFEAATAALSEL